MLSRSLMGGNRRPLVEKKRKKKVIVSGKPFVLASDSFIRIMRLVH